MSKITRRSYKRKKIIMGATLFGAIGLVSTGFAAWVLSSPAIDSKGAQLNVGSVSDKNMKFETIKIYKTGDSNKETDNTYSFNPQQGDNTGRVRWGSVEEGEEPESLSLTVEATITNAQNLKDVTVSIALVDAVDDALDKFYIVAPESYGITKTIWDGGVSGSKQSEFVDYEGTTPFSGDVEKTMTFTYEVKFAWGTAFDGKNPSEYFDTTNGLTAYPKIGDSDDTLSDGTVAGVLNDLYTTLNGVELTLTLTANPN